MASWGQLLCTLNLEFIKAGLVGLHKLEAYATKKRQGLVKRPCLFSFQETEVTRNFSLLPLEFDTEPDGSCRSISISSKDLHEVGRSYTQVRVTEVRCIGDVEGLSAELA